MTTQTAASQEATITNGVDVTYVLDVIGGVKADPGGCGSGMANVSY